MVREDNNQIIFNELIRKGFLVEEYRPLGQFNPSYMMVGYGGSLPFCVVYSNETNYEVNASSAKDYMRNKGYEKVYLNNVIEVMEDNNITPVSGDGVIVINGKTRKIVYEKNAHESLTTLVISLEQKPRDIKELFNATNILIALNVIIFLISAIISGSLNYIEGSVLYNLGAKWSPAIKEGQFYRLFTSMFLHGGIVHLLFNMYALWSLGNLVEKVWGTKRFLIVYFGGGFIASLATFIFSPKSLSVGASGAIFALLGAAAIFGYFIKDKFGKEFMNEMLKLIGINIFIGITTPNIDNVAHIGGLIGGAIISFGIYELNRK